MKCGNLFFSRHAIQRMFERSVSAESVGKIIGSGEIIASYPEDKPYPGFLILGWIKGGPVHIVMAQDAETASCFVITVYQPDPAIWASDFRTRRLL